MNNNAKKKKEIDDILVNYMAKISTLKQKRDSVLTNFLGALKERRINEIRQSIK